MSPDAGLVRRMDASLVTYWSACALTQGSLYETHPGAVCLFAPIPQCLVNSVNLTAAAPVSVDGALANAAGVLRNTPHPHGPPGL